MSKRILSLLLALALVLGLFPAGAMSAQAAEDPGVPSKTVYFTLSNDGAVVVGNDAKTTRLNRLKVTVPYFDLALYELQDFYRYEADPPEEGGGYNSDVVVEQPTLLHLYIYMLERFYYGVAEQDCGKGAAYLKEHYDVTFGDTNPDLSVDEFGLMIGDGSKDGLYITGSATSMYMQSFWGHDENLMYFVNHQYPLMREGWGATADYILLEDGDDCSVAMFSNWDFYNYGHFGFAAEGDSFKVDLGSGNTKLTFTAMGAPTSAGLNGETQDPEEIDAMWCIVKTEPCEFGEWYVTEDFPVDHVFTYDFAELEPGTYVVVGMDVNAGSEGACNAPVTATVEVVKGTPAAEPVSAKVDFTAQASGAFLCAPQYDVEVSSDLAERYGYADGVDLGKNVSALDVLVKAHEIVFGEDFTKDTASDYLTVSNGNPSMAFGVEGLYSGFFVNNAYPHDGTKSDWGYNGTLVGTQPMKDGDLVEFFYYEDDYWMDTYTWFEDAEGYARSFSATAGKALELTLNGAMAMGGSSYFDVNEMVEDGDPVADAQVYTVDLSTGAVTAIPGAVTDEKGKVSLTFDKAGTYTICAYSTEDSDCALVMSLTTVEVAEPPYVPTGEDISVKLNYAGETAKLYAAEDTALTFDYLAKAELEGSTYTTKVPAGDYRLYAYDSATGNCYGSMKLVVTEDGQPTGLGDNAERNCFNVLTVYGIKATNSGFVAGTDYTVTVEAWNNALTFNREVQLGTDKSGLTSTLCLEGDGVTAAFTPNAELHPTYIPVTVTKTLNSSTSITAAIPEGVNITFVVPEGAKVDAGTFRTYYVYEFRTPIAVEGNAYTYRLPKNTDCFYRVDKAGEATYWNYAKWTADTTVTVTDADINMGIDGFGAKTVYRHFEQNKYDLADIYLNINEKGYMNLNVGESFTINAFRNWYGVESFSNAKVASPNYHYEVIDFDGTPSDVVTIAPNAKMAGEAVMTANHEGTAVVLVTYDAMTHQASSMGKVYSAIWPERTGVFVVSVGKDGTAIAHGMTINEGQNTAGGFNEKLVGDTLDAEHDILFYLGEEGASYSFRPETGVTVSVAHPTLTANSLTYTGWNTEDVTVEDGTVTLSGLTTGRHIVKLEKDGAASYQVITAQAVTYKLTDSKGNEITYAKPGQTVKVVFSGLNNPAEKLSGVYNFNANVHYFGQDGTEFGGGTGGFGVYDFNSNATRQTLTVKIPTGFEGDTYTLVSGDIRLGGFGWPAGSHRGTTYAKGLGQNFTARSVNMYLADLPVIVIDTLSPVEKVEKLIAAIGEVGFDSGDAIRAAREAYDALTDEEKALVSNYQTLVDAEKAYEELMNPAFLSVLRLTAASGAAAAEYKLYNTTDRFHLTVEIPDCKTGTYLWATLSDKAPAGSTITAKWVNLYNGKEQTAAITSGKSSGQSLANFTRTATDTNTLTVTVGKGDLVQTYTITDVHTPTLASLGLDGVKLNETFDAMTAPYTAKTIADSVTVQAVPYAEGYTVTVNGGTDPVVTLTEGENTITVVVTNEAGYSMTYTVTVTKVPTALVTFVLEPKDATLCLTDSFGTRIWPNAEGVYELMATASYNYTVSKNGYVGVQGAIESAATETITVTLTEAAGNPSLNPDLDAEWPNFRNGENHLGITDAKTPYTPEDAELLWAEKYGTGWSAAPGSPILVDGCLVTYVGSTIKKLDPMTGKVLAEGTMVASSSYSIVPATYAEGMIFVGLSGGRIQCFDAQTLESLWVYTDSLGGQPNCPITYADGYVYAGFWNSEVKDANFACISVTDEDTANTTEAKLPTWVYRRAGGFYWAGAFVKGGYVLFGTDDGASGYTTEGASLMVLDKRTGKVVDSHDGIRGDIRSNVSYDPASDRVFFTSKGGVLCNAKIDWTTGKITDFDSVVITDSKGNRNAMSTCTPSVYNGRIYIGVSGASQFGAFSGHGISVFDLAADGTMTNAYVYDIMGYPQTSAMLTTAYMEDEGYVYIYLPYNYTPGGVSVLKDKPGQTEPLTTTDSGYSEVFTPVGSLAQYCICSTIADQYGTIYYKNDSAYMMAITSKILNIEIVDGSFTVNADGTVSAENLKVVSNLANGLQRDITDYVTLALTEGECSVTVTYTYGFDNASYGCKTQTAKAAIDHSYTTENTDPTCTEPGLTVYTCAHCGDTYSVVGEAALGHSYEDAVVEPACLSSGYTVHSCSRCDASYLDTLVPALGHSYTAAVTAEPTCTEEGTKTYTCSRCDDTYTESVPAAGHSYAFVNSSAATCTEDGYTGDVICSVCGDVLLEGKTIPALGHSYEVTAHVDAACTEDGYETKVCTVCGDEVTEILEAPGHNLEEVVTEAACTENGVIEYTCTVCGTIVESVEIAAEGHDYACEVTDPTCTEDGAYVYTCSKCGDTYSEVIAAPGHDYESVVTDPTCTEQGYTTYTCIVCGDEYADDYTDALGHDYESVVTDPTCTEQGFTTYTCSVCGDEYVDDYTDALGHDYASVVTEPTCTEDGCTTYTCANCGDTYTEVIPAVGHKYAVVNRKDASCTEDGYTGDVVCSVCGDVLLEGRAIAALGHSYETVGAVDPTCTEDGYTGNQVCSVCGDTVEGEAIPALGHSYEIVSAVDPTCTETGYTGDQICAICGSEITGEEIPALGHTWCGWEVSFEATCFEDGSEHRHCSVCDEIEIRVIAANSDNCPSAKFEDVPAAKWFHKAVDFVVSNGIMSGVSETSFAPTATLTRAQMVTILYNMAGQPEVDGESRFTDVAEGKWYTSAVIWATENGITSGTGNGVFSPNAALNRAQMVTFLANYAKLEGKFVAAEADLSAFADASAVPGWAAESMNWAIANGIISGSNGKLDPKGTANRAAVASVILAYCENIVIE